MFAIQFPAPQPPTSFSAPQDMYAPNLHPVPMVSKAKRGPPKLSLQITSETRRIFTKSSTISLPPPPTSAAAGPMSPTALATMRNTQLNATRNDAAMAEEARRNGAGRHRRRRGRVCFADGHEVIGYAHGPESASVPDSASDSASSSSSEEDSSDDDRSPVVRQGSWGSNSWNAPPTRADRGFGYDRRYS